MARFNLEYLKCERVASGVGVDHTYAEIFVDGERYRWPQSGHIIMVAGSEEIINRHYEFRRNIVVKLWDYDSGSGNDFMGLFEFSSDEIGREYIFIHNLGEGDRYRLHYTHVPEHKAGNFNNTLKQRSVFTKLGYTTDCAKGSNVTARSIQ